jgi:hypothetical protein
LAAVVVLLRAVEAALAERVAAAFLAVVERFVAAVLRAVLALVAIGVGSSV